MSVRNLKIAYESRDARLVAVNGINLNISEEEFVAVIGESGCGKSTLALSIIGLLPQRSAHVLDGSIVYKGKDLFALDSDEMRSYRGTEIAMIFQEPLTHLNPVIRIGEQVAEAIVIREARTESGRYTQTSMSKDEVDVVQRVYRLGKIHLSRFPRPKRSLHPLLRMKTIEALRLVRIPDPEEFLNRYPFELSGGMCQRVMLAMAFSQRPKLLLADEPTTALDVTTQAHILKLMKELISTIHTSILLITHDLAVASQVADRVVVMYAGEFVEDADAYSLFSEPLHPYTMALLSCIPSGSRDEKTLIPIPGSVPDLMNPPKGCRYASRCPFAMDSCKTKEPTLIEIKPGHQVACFLYVK